MLKLLLPFLAASEYAKPIAGLTWAQLPVGVAVARLTVLKDVRKPWLYLQNVFTLTMMTFLQHFGWMIPESLTV
ncbi:hypothetical protein FDUTEX481_09924 [Tolypothrix sp. PCC 7601]|nr:hypothetical protein FDUTEX481_09924 [Tolypothrix sp. PCC 7601]